MTAMHSQSRHWNYFRAGYSIIIVIWLNVHVQLAVRECIHLYQVMNKRPSISVSVTVAQPQATSRVVNQISNAVNAPASTSLFLTTSQQS